MIPSTMLISLSKVFQRQDQKLTRIAEEQAAMSAQNRALAERLEQLESHNRSLITAIERLSKGMDRLPTERPFISRARTERDPVLRPVN